jgi:hypothetical protein
MPARPAPIKQTFFDIFEKCAPKLNGGARTEMKPLTDCPKNGEKALAPAFRALAMPLANSSDRCDMLLSLQPTNKQNGAAAGGVHDGV